MDRRWERNGKDEAEPWESVSPSEDEEGESSAGEFEGTDMVMVQQAVADEGFYVLEFPRRELGAVLEGINKFPWVVYPVHLISLMSYACKALGMGIEVHSDIRRLQALYREAVPGTLEKCLDDKAIWRWSADVQINIFQAIKGLIDLVVLKLSQLRMSRAGDFAVMDDLLPLLQTLAIAFDKHCQFHLKHKETAVPTAMVASSEKSNYAKPFLGTPVRQKNGEWHCARRKIQVKEVEDCDCERCRPPNVYCLLAHLMNYFGHTSYGDGYKQLAEVLSAPQKLPPAIIEALLLLLARTVDFISDEGVQIFLEPCNVVLSHVADCLEKDVDALSDKTRRDSFGTLSMILRHLRAIIARGSSAENAENVVSIVQRRMVERMLGFQSFNKQLSAVREINKLLENARSVASRDNGKSVCTTIEWLERNNILHHTLRSHLHHKQYVDQVQNIMRLLLLEHRLSEEHLDAIWAATEKPDQFEAVKANVFDLIADLAWSFSDKQLDSLFGRLKHVQGRSAGDIIKILTFLKKLARSDNKGIMAERLLELLWNMMFMGEAPGEVLESGAFTEILGHYISVDRASQDVYILRCLAKVKAGESVIPSLRLLRDIIWLDNEKPFYKGQVSRQMRLQQLINDHNLIDLVVSSLVQYVAMPRMACSTRTPNSKTLDGQFNHDENIKERLSFLQFALQSGAVCLPWESAERLWNCLVELPTCTADEESGLQWFCEVLEKRALSVDSQENLLTKKITKVWPSSMSQTAWRCFKQLFVHVNLNQKKLKQLRHDYAVGINDLDLVGLPYLWQITLWSRNKIIVEESINMLRDIHTSLVENLQQDLITIREDFIDKCMEHLICALDNGESWKSIEDVKKIKTAAIQAVLNKTLPEAMSSVKDRALRDSEHIETKYNALQAAFSPSSFLSYDVAVDLAPEVKWISPEAYKNLKVVVEVESDAAIERAAEAELKSRHKNLGSLKIVQDRGVKIGDVVVLDVSATQINEDGTDGDKLPFTEQKGFHLDTEESTHLVPGFVNAILGLETGQTRSFQLAFPDTWKQKELQGVLAHFTVECKELFYRDLPVLDDTLADKLANGCTSLSQVQESILQEHKKIAEAKKKQVIQRALLQELSKVVEMDVPNSLLEEHGRQLYGAKLIQLQITMKLTEDQILTLSSAKAVNNYLLSQKETIKEIVKQTLAVEEIFKIENLQYSEEELEKEAEDTAAEFKSYNHEFDRDRVREQAQEFLKGEKVLQFLMQHADITYMLNDA